MQDQTLSPVELVALMWRMAQTDEDLKLEEVKYIHDMGKILGLSRTEVDLLATEYKAYPLNPPTSEQDRMTYLYHILFQMKIDGEVCNDEVGFVNQLGLKLGVRDDLVNELVQIMKDHIGKTVPISLMLNCIKKYLN